MADTDNKYYYNALDKDEAHIMQNIIFSKRNSLLNKFTIEEYAALSGHLELITMGVGEVLYEVGEEAPYVLFPIDSMVSLLHPMKNGNSAEIAIIGCDGAIGIARNNQATLNCAIVTEPGNAYRIRKIFSWKKLSETNDYSICSLNILKYFLHKLRK